MTPNAEPPDPARTLHFDSAPGWRSRRRDARPRRAPRALLLAAVALLHAWLLPRLLEVAQLPLPQAAAPHLTQVILLAAPRAAPPPSPPPPRLAARRIDRAAPPRRVAPARPLQVVETSARRAPPSPAPPRLFRADGSIALPPEVADELARSTRADRVFDYRVPGVEEALGFAQRRAPLDYQATRFDAHWAEPQDLLTEALGKAVEKSTATVRIPIPRKAGSYVVCKVSLVAMGGGCGIENASDGYLVVLNDPATLNAEEDAQCQAWWNGIVAATTFEQWRALMDRYEAECRKPRAAGRDRPGPATATPAAAAAGAARCDSSPRCARASRASTAGTAGAASSP